MAPSLGALTHPDMVPPGGEQGALQGSEETPRPLAFPADA